MWASCVCNAWADEPRFNQNQTGTTNTQSTTAQALYKNSLYKKMRGWIFLPHICFVEYIYICKWKIKNWGTLEFLRLNKLDVCEGAPLRPCSIFLTMKWFIKILFGAGNGASLPWNQTPAKMNFAQPRHGWEWQAKSRTNPGSSH